MRTRLTIVGLVVAALAALLAAGAVSARCLDEDCRPTVPSATATWAPLWTATPAATTAESAMSADMPAAAEVEPAGLAAATPTFTPIPCPLDWSLPYSDENYQLLAHCRALHYIETGEIACPPPGTVWYDDYFQDGFCHPAPGTTPLPPPPPWWTPAPPWYHTPTPTS